MLVSARTAELVRVATAHPRCHDDRVDEEIIPILRVEDAEVALKWYELVGFTAQWKHRFEANLPAFVEITRGQLRVFLSEHEGDAPPNTLIYLRVHDVDAIAAEFGMSPEEAPWAREIELRDPDGNRLRVGTPLG